jgi:hypothetical protein
MSLASRQDYVNFFKGEGIDILLATPSISTLLIIYPNRKSAAYKRFDKLLISVRAFSVIGLFIKPKQVGLIKFYWMKLTGQILSSVYFDDDKKEKNK